MRLRNRLVPDTINVQRSTRRRELDSFVRAPVTNKRRRITRSSNNRNAESTDANSILMPSPIVLVERLPEFRGPIIISNNESVIPDIAPTTADEPEESRDENLRSESENETDEQRRQPESDRSVSPSTDTTDEPMESPASDNTADHSGSSSKFCRTITMAPQSAWNAESDPIVKSTLPRIGNYQLMKLMDETTNMYDAVNMLDRTRAIARRLDRKKHIRRLQLSHRLSKGSSDSDENRRIFELLFPSRMTFAMRREERGGKKETWYYWFEPPNEGSLHAHVIERKRLPEHICRDYFKQICQIVEYCHARGVVIRDLKLRKFVFADSGKKYVKLDDLDETAICPESKTDDYESIDWDDYDPDDDLLCDRHGCPAYVSPEILDLSKKWYSGKPSDVWSLGVLLYVMLVGRYPFYDVTPAGLFTKIRQARIHLSDQDGVKMEPRLLIRMMLRRDPKERPSVTDVLANSWLQSKDYKSTFKTFSTRECLFWKPNTIVNADAGTSSALTSSASSWFTRRPTVSECPAEHDDAVAVANLNEIRNVGHRDVVVGQ